MFKALNLQVSSPAIKPNCTQSFTGSFASHRPLALRLPKRSLACISLESNNASSEPSTSSHFTSTIGSSPPSSLQLSHWNLTQRHVVVLNVITCVTAISATWLFCSAIPTLLAFKRAAESLEKLLDATREELPDTMAAVRLSGMELSDLTMELSDLGQGITQGVRGSTKAISIAQERLIQMTNMAPSASVQEVATLETKTPVPMIAKTARGIREAIVKSRSIFQMFFTLNFFSRMALNYFSSWAKQ